MIRTILFLVFIVMIFVGLAGLIANNAKTKKVKDVKHKKKINIISCCVAGFAMLLALFIPGSFHQVEAGQVAVVKSLGRVVDVRFPGTYFDFYMTHSYTYFDTTIQKLDINTASYSSDAQTMRIQMTVQYKIDASKVENILLEYTNMESLEQRIEKVADDTTKSILSKYTAMKIIETRSSISPEVERTIKTAVGDRYYVTVTAVNLTNIDFTDEFEKAVEDKVVAEQQKEAAITKAEQELEVAKLKAEAAIVEAQANAESQKIMASAAAKALAVKIVELARSIGFDVSESYTKSTQTIITDTLTQKVISDVVLETEELSKPQEGVVVTYDEEKNQMTSITTTIKATNYSISYDEQHTKDDLKFVMEFVQYLEYLEKWDGELPQVVTGDKGISIMIPTIKDEEPKLSL